MNGPVIDLCGCGESRHLRACLRIVNQMIERNVTPAQIKFFISRALYVNEHMEIPDYRKGQLTPCGHVTRE